MKLEQGDETPLYFKALIYGPFGVGKTFFAGGALDVPEMEDVLWLKCEDGAMTIKHRTFETSPLIEKMEQIDDAFWSLAQRKKGFENFKCVVLDGGSALLQTVLRQIVDMNCAKNPNKDPFLPSQHDYGQMTFNMRRIIRRFTQLPMHVIITAMLREQYDTDDELEKIKRGPKRCVPDFTPKVGEDAMAAVDMVWPLMAKENGTRVILTQRKGPWMAKTRGELFAKQLGPMIENPSLPAIFEILKATQGKHQ